MKIKVFEGAWDEETILIITKGHHYIVATADRLMDQCDTLEAQLEWEQTLGEELLDAVLHGAARGEEKSRAPEPIAVG